MSRICKAGRHGAQDGLGTERGRGRCENGLKEVGLPEAGGPGIAAHSPSRPGRVPETHHAGVDRSLFNVPCNACDKCIPVLEVRVKVGLWELEDRNIWLLKNRSNVAGCPGNALLPTNATSSLWKAMSTSPSHLPSPKSHSATLDQSCLQTGPTSASHQGHPTWPWE